MLPENATFKRSLAGILWGILIGYLELALRKGNGSCEYGHVCLSGESFLRVCNIAVCQGHQLFYELFVKVHLTNCQMWPRFTTVVLQKKKRKKKIVRLAVDENSSFKQVCHHEVGFWL